MSLLEVKNLSHTFGDKLLYKNASFELYKGEHMGLVGRNGVGKSTLIKTLIGEVIPDEGQVKWHPKTKVGHLDQYAQLNGAQTIFAYLRTAFEYLYAIEQELEAVNDRLTQTGDMALVEESIRLQEELEAHDFYALDGHIQKVASGLGITALGMDSEIGKLSGGQRAKVILAKLLLDEPDVLLLDEPTNFLDHEHVEWLAKYLKGFPNAFILISHDFEFLERVTTCICDMENGQIQKYHGSYLDYLRQKAEKDEQYRRQYESQRKLIKRTEEYIARNKARASTAGMARGRQKQLDKIERLPPPTKMPKPHFSFPYTPVTAQNVLEIRGLEVGYYYPLLPKLDFAVKNRSRVVITGFNGIGKSTLLKTLIGEIPKLSGEFAFAENVKIGYFEQDLRWEDEGATPLSVIADAYPKMAQKDVRKALSRCGISAEHALQPVGTLSGGEQAKVKLCRLMLTPYNLLIFDEPTNHLDKDAKEALLQAIKEFEGTVLLVSHEQSFYKDWADDVWNIERYLMTK